MTLKAILREYSRKRMKNLCVNCTNYMYMKSVFFCGMTTTGTCKHTEGIKSEFKMSLVGMYGTRLFSLILFAAVSYQFLTSYDGELRFWNLKNLKAMGELCFGLAQSLMMVCYTRDPRIFPSLMGSMQACICKLKTIVGEVEIIERYVYRKLIGDCFTLFSICVSAFFTLSKYMLEDTFDMVIMLRIFSMYQMNLGFVTFMDFHKIAMDICYDKLRRILTFTVNDGDSYRLTDIVLAEEDLDSILDFRRDCYRAFSKINEFISPGVYLFIVLSMVGYYFMLLIAIIITLDGELFRLTSQTSFVFQSVISILILSYVCYVAQELKEMDNPIRSFIYRCRLGRMISSDVYKVEVLLHLFDSQRFEVVASGAIMFSHQFYATLVLLVFTNVLVGLQFYMEE